MRSHSLKKSVVRMVNLSTALLTAAWGLSAQPAYNPEIRPYVEFLKSQNVSAKEYILKLFESHDIVIICERDHRDITQYNLFLSIIEDDRFIKTVGNIFTEVGVSTLNPELNRFLHSEGMSTDSVDGAILRFHRNCDFSPIWEKQNFSYLIRVLYSLNQRLPDEKKVNLYPSDMPFDWNTIDAAGLKTFWDRIGTRDSVMASQIIQKFEEIKKTHSNRKKAFVIMNFRHAFNRDVESLSGVKRDNVGRYLFNRYGERAANVLMNSFALTAVRSDKDIGYSAIRGGKWDAAFIVLDREDAGFNFQGSPFGEDRFDIAPIKQQLKFRDVFTGFAYYLPLEKHRCVVGVPGIIDSAFFPELLRRYQLSNTLPNQSFKYSTDIEALKNEYNIKREFQLEGLDSLTAEIGRWLR